MKGGKGVNVKEIPCDKKLEWPLLALKKKGHQPKNTGDLKNLEKEMASPTDPPEGMECCRHLGFSSEKPLLDFSPPELQESQFVILSH